MTLQPNGTQRGGHSATLDRLGERALREEIRTEIARLLGERQLLEPRAEDEVRIRTLIHERVAAYQRRAAATNAPLLLDPEGVEQRLFDGLLRLGILQPLMEAADVEEVICNGPHRIFVIEDGRKRLIPDLYFEDDEELRQLVKRLIGPIGRRLDESSPMVDARLPDGSRLNAAIPPATTRWCCVTIRKFLLRAHALEELVELGTLTESAAAFLDAAVQAGVNILVSGPTGAGKTTLLNALGASIASIDERIVTVEEVAELQLERQLPDCVALQARASNIEGAGEVSIRDLVRNALRMRPTRIVVGEVRGAEALDMLLAMNTGHEGDDGRGAPLRRGTDTHGGAHDRARAAAALRAADRPPPCFEHLRGHRSRGRRHRRPRAVDSRYCARPAELDGHSATLTGKDARQSDRLRAA